MSDKLDSIDIEILRILQPSARIRLNELAEKIELSLPAVSERIRKLEERGFIRAYNTVIDPLKVGLEVTAFIFVVSESSVHYPEIVKKATSHPEILECHAVTGEGSHLLKIRTRNTASLERLLSHIQSWPGVVNTKTSVVLSTRKETSVVSLPEV